MSERTQHMTTSDPSESDTQNPDTVERVPGESSRQGSEFDPTPFLRQLRGRGGASEYLDVKWRLLWLRKEHPDAKIITELVKFEPQMAIFKATVSLPSGGKATGYGSETAGDFADFIEKAETKAIGRALNALGYGAQFSERGEETTEEPAQAPPSRPVSLPPRQGASAAPAAAPKSPRTQESSLKTPAAPEREADLADYSWSAFWPWARERGLNGPREVEILIGQAVAGLSPAELRDLIVAADAQR